MRRKKSADRITELWNGLFTWGQKNRVTSDEWGTLILRMQVNVSVNIAEKSLPINVALSLKDMPKKR